MDSTQRWTVKLWPKKPSMCRSNHQLAYKQAQDILESKDTALAQKISMQNRKVLKVQLRFLKQMADHRRQARMQVTSTSLLKAHKVIFMITLPTTIVISMIIVIVNTDSNTTQRSASSASSVVDEENKCLLRCQDNPTHMWDLRQLKTVMVAAVQLQGSMNILICCIAHLMSYLELIDCAFEHSDSLADSDSWINETARALMTFTSRSHIVPSHKSCRLWMRWNSVFHNWTSCIISQILYDTTRIILHNAKKSMCEQVKPIRLLWNS